jgi:hypothetical protein
LGSGGGNILSRINYAGIFALLVVAGVILTVIKFVDFSPADPLDVHRAVIRKRTLKLIHESASPDWTSVKVRFVMARFDDMKDPKLACCKIAYEISEGDVRKMNQIRMTMVKKTSEDPEAELDWEFSEIAIPDSPRVALTLYEILTRTEEPTKPKKRRRKKKTPLPPRPDHHCDKLQGKWNTYRWLSFDPEKHKGAIQGLAPKEWLKSE